MEGKEREIYEEEIDLYELFLKLKKRWRVIFVTLLAGVLSAYIYAFHLAQPLYRISVFVKPGVAYYGAGDEPRLSFQSRDFSKAINGINLYLRK